jgi:ABC-2 type transport system ATP-binding protein
VDGDFEDADAAPSAPAEEKPTTRTSAVKIVAARPARKPAPRTGTTNADPEKTAAVKAATARNATARSETKAATGKTTAAKSAAAKVAADKAAKARAARAAAAKAERAAARAAKAKAAEDEAALRAAEPEPDAVTAAGEVIEASPDAAPEELIAELLDPEQVATPEPAPDGAPEPLFRPEPEPVPDAAPEPLFLPEPVPEPEPQPQVDAAAAAEAVVTDVHAPAASDAIIVRGLVKDFGDHRAVNGIDLTVPAGSFYGIVGPNGAGKTTTLSILAGLLRADAGTVEICGIDQAKNALGAKRVMGVLPDRLRTFDRLTGRQLLHYYGLLRGLSADVIEKRSTDLMRAFDLAGSVGRVVSDYSAGMTKKIMLAGAMIHSPRVLVLDEPFESVDPVSSAVILDILRAYVDHGGTVILSSHGMDLVERVCSRVAIIVGGDVLAEGTIDEVRAGRTLESRFVELSGGAGEVEGLEWLHTFSD